MSELNEQAVVDEADDEKESLRDFFKSKGLFIIIWLFCFVVVSIVFLVKLDDIKTNLKDTRFFERIFGSTPVFIENHVSKKEKQKTDLGEKETVINIDKISGRNVPRGDDISETIPMEESVWSRPTESLVEEPPADVQQPGDDVGAAGIDYEIPTEEQPAAEVEPPAVYPVEEEFIPKSIPVDNSVFEEKPVRSLADVQMMNAKLWFVSVDADGRITRRQCTRRIVKADAPLTNNIKLILQGPDSRELDDGCMSLIPNGTRLITALVKDGVAFLNFSPEFESNRLGAEGYLAQLQQVVFTSTEFATVKSVQILIDGHKKETLGDGVWIGSPLSRSDFK